MYQLNKSQSRFQGKAKILMKIIFLMRMMIWFTKKKMMKRNRNKILMRAKNRKWT